MTLGPALVFLWAVDGRTPLLLHPTLTFWQGATFFLLAAHSVHTLDYRWRMLRALSTRALDV